MRSGRPELIVPFAHDQPDNAFRVRQLGVARVVYPRRYRAARVARELAALRSGSAYAAAAADASASTCEPKPGRARPRTRSWQFLPALDAEFWPGPERGQSPGDITGNCPRSHRKMLLATNQTLAGRSASRRMYHGNQ